MEVPIRGWSLVLLNVFLLMTLLFPVNGNVLNNYYSLASPISAETPKVILQSGTAGSSTIYTNNTSAKVTTAAPAPTPTYYPNGYNVVTGTYLSGSVPASVQTVDANYFIVRSVGTSTTAYNPSGYNLLGSTKYVSGSSTDLQSDNSVYMTFRSYVSASSTTAKTNAFIAYRDSTTTLNTPKERTWTGNSVAWGSQTEMATSGSPVRFTRVAYCPIENRSTEKIVVTLSDDGYLDAYVWDGTSWTVTNNIANVGTTANAYKCFDVAYEKTSGEALLVYSIAPATNFRMAYKTWSPSSGWSGENIYVIFPTGIAQTAYWISMASKPTSGANEIAVGVLGYELDDNYGIIWNGASFVSQRKLTDTGSIATEECIAVAYEQSSGYATFVSSGGNDAFSWQWSGSAWDVSATTFDLSGASIPNWFTLKANPINDELFCVCVDSASDLNTAYWSGSAWTIHTEHDASVDTDAQRPADFAWEPTGSKGLLVWGTTTGVINWKSFTAPDTWPSSGAPAMAGDIHPWVQLRTNPRSISGDVKILGIVLTATIFDIGAIQWDGTTFTVIGTNTISSDTTVITYECFEMEFQNFGPPSEFTSNIEFTGTSNTQSWDQLIWTVDSSFTVTGVTATFYLYNWNTNQYPSSGDGYMTDTIGTSDVTKTQTITTNPTYYRNSTGGWKMKIKGVKSPSSQFDWKADFVQYQFRQVNSASTEFLFSNMTKNTPTQLNFTVVSEYNITSVSVTIQVWNYSSSPQAYVTSGEGYLTYTSTGTNVTKALSITTNPQFYTSSGKTKIKVTGINSTTTQFQQKINQIKLTYRYNASSTYDYVLKVVNQVTSNWTATLKIYNNSKIGRLSSLNISLHDGASSNQIAISGGTIIKSEGEPYNLPGGLGSAIKISISNLQATTTDTSYLYVYLKITVPNTSTYNLFIIVFEIT